MLIDTVMNLWPGDANLDGVFNASDLVSVLAAGEYGDNIVGNSNWSTGDWDGDGEFDTSDLVVALDAGGYERGPREAVAVVPEPGSSCLLLLGVLGILGSYCRCRG